MTKSGYEYVIRWPNIVFYGLTVGIVIGLLDLVIGYKFYSMHGNGFSFGTLHLAPFFISVCGIVGIWRSETSKTSLKFVKVALFLLLNIIGLIVGLLYLPAVLY